MANPSLTGINVLPPASSEGRAGTPVALSKVNASRRAGSRITGTAGGPSLEIRNQRWRHPTRGEVRGKTAAAVRRIDAGGRRAGLGLGPAGSVGPSLDVRHGGHAALPSRRDRGQPQAAGIRPRPDRSTRHGRRARSRRTPRWRRHCVDVHRRRDARKLRRASCDTRADGAPEPNAAHCGSLCRRNARGGSDRRSRRRRSNPGQARRGRTRRRHHHQRSRGHRRIGADRRGHAAPIRQRPGRHERFAECR